MGTISAIIIALSTLMYSPSSSATVYPNDETGQENQSSNIVVDDVWVG